MDAAQPLIDEHDQSINYASAGSSPTKIKKFIFFNTRDTKIPRAYLGIFDLVGSNPIDWNRLEEELQEWWNLYQAVQRQNK